jgi:hypothetical protein
VHPPLSLCQGHLLEAFLFLGDLLSSVSEPLVANTLVRCISDARLIDHVGDHGLHLLPGLIGAKGVHKLQLLIHVGHLLDGLIVGGLRVPPTGSSHFILESLDDLVELVGALDGDSVGLVLMRVENCHVVVTCLVLVANLRRVALRLILNTFIGRLEDAADALS